MGRVVWMLAAIVAAGVGALVFARGDLALPVVSEIASRPPAAGAGSGAAADFPVLESDEARAPETADAGTDPVQAVARASGRALGTESERDAQIDEELRVTERALATSRRRSESAAAGPSQRASPASRAALAAAAAGSSAVALGCQGSGRACLSGAECCPGLACAGGVAGYGTVGRCQAPR